MIVECVKVVLQFELCGDAAVIKTILLIKYSVFSVRITHFLWLAATIIYILHELMMIRKKRNIALC